MYQGNPYKVLGIKPGTDRKIVDKTFRKLARIHHPDVGGTHEEYVELQAAYEAIVTNMYVPGVEVVQQFTLRHTSLFTFEKVGI